MTTLSFHTTGNAFLAHAWMRNTERSSLWRRWDCVSTQTAAILSRRSSAARCSIVLGVVTQTTARLNVKGLTGKDTGNSVTKLWRRRLHLIRNHRNVLLPMARWKVDINLLWRASCSCRHYILETAYGTPRTFQEISVYQLHLRSSTALLCNSTQLLSSISICTNDKLLAQNITKR